jgi:hypothetical protein
VDKPAPKDSQAFWTVAIGVPVLLSVLRLWVEAGGELQTTLLLVEHIDPVNLVAALVATGTWLVSAIFVGGLAIGGVLNGSGPAGERYWIARWANTTPVWIKAGAFGLAALTWQVLYLPLLLLAACAAFQLRPRGWLSYLGAVAFGTLYSFVVAPTLVDAWRHGPPVSGMTILLLCGPPLLCLFVAGPLRPWIVRPWAVVTQALAVLLFAWVAVPLLTTPILPHTVTVIKTPPEFPNGPPDYLGGFVVTSDNTHTAILAEQGGITYVPNDRITAQFLCPTSEEIPRYPLSLHALGIEIEVEHSILRGLGRADRHATPLHPACRVPAGG